MKKLNILFLLILKFFSAESQTNIPVEPVAEYFNSIGVNISPIKYESPHLHNGNFIKSPDDSLYFQNLKFFLQEAGFKYVRAAIPIELMCGNPTHMQDSILALSRLKKLYDELGIKTFWVLNHYAVAPWNPLNNPACHLDTIKMDNASYIDQVKNHINPATNMPFGLDYIYAVEGLNEPEHFIISGSDTASNVQSFYSQKWDEITYRTQVGLFNKITSGSSYNHMKVLAPSIWKFYEGAIDSLTAQGPIQNFFEAGNLHPYPTVVPPYPWDKLNYHPSFFVPHYLQTFYGNNPNYGNSYSKYVTETGYQSQVSMYDTSITDINEIEAAKYVSFLHFEFFKNGIEKVLFYKLFENGHNAEDDRYGLARQNYSTKPMFNTLINISKIFSDTSNINNELDSIAFTINYINPNILNTKVYQQKDNQIILAIWRKDVNSACYDINNAILSINPINFSITLNNHFQKAYLYDPVNSILPIDSTSNSNIINLSLSDRAFLIKIRYDNTTGVNSSEYLDNNLNIYPNPAQNSIYIKFKSSATEFNTLQIFDSQGQLIQFYRNVILPEEISVQDLTPGIYLIRLVNKNNTYITKKIIITR